MDSEGTGDIDLGEMAVYHLFLLVLLVFNLQTSESAVENDRIQHLPGINTQPSFKQYSGYLKASDKKFLHYWLVESQGSPEKDPLIVWMNGGPGCSSLDGLLTENGPFRINDDGVTLTYNPYSWNKMGNVLYLEAPAGVGYSYATDGNIITDDDITARNNHAALQDFMKKYPEYHSRDFYITGESYAGIYIPTLLVLVKDDPMFNLKGAAIGNGALNFPLLHDSLMYYYYYHGLLGNVLWTEMLHYCCKEGNISSCKFFPSQNPDCQRATGQAMMKIAMIPLNPYNLIGECSGGSASRSTRISAFLNTMMKYMKYSVTDKQAMNTISMMSVNLEVSIPCINSSSSTHYLNQPIVRKALHIAEGLPPWAVCSMAVHATYVIQYPSMYKQVMSVLNDKKYRLLVYNGDMDMACNFLGDQMFVDLLNQKELIPHKEWYYTAKDGSKQIGGFVRQFENISFLTVRGAGHMVPTDRPIPAFVMLQNFLENRPF